MAKIMPIMAALALVTLRVHSAEPVDWQLPISIGDSRFEVYQELGIPNEIIDYDKMIEITSGESANADSMFYFPPEQSNEYFYDKGFFISFWDDAVSMIVVWGPTDDEGGSRYLGPVVNDLTTRAVRDGVIEHLGAPDMMRTDPLDLATTSDILLYSYSYLFWDYDHYRIEVQIANDDHILDADKNIVRPVDTINLIRITAIDNVDED